MSKYITLKENRDFRRLYSKGKSYVSAGIVVYVCKNHTNSKRFGITTSKKTGTAVLRSRSRRVIREAYYELYDNIKNGYDFVFVARAKTPHLKSYDILRFMKELLKKAGVLI